LPDREVLNLTTGRELSSPRSSDDCNLDAAKQLVISLMQFKRESRTQSPQRAQRKLKRKLQKGNSPKREFSFG